MINTKPIKFDATKSSGEVSGFFNIPDSPKCLYIYAHGAGAPMQHPFLSQTAQYLADEGIAVFRFNFPYMEKKFNRPDPAPILMETIRSAVKLASENVKGTPVFAGGKSMGGRMSSMAASSEKSLEGVKGLIFFGFPLHAPGKPSDERAEHLYNVKIPMLFLQGTRDKLADLQLLRPVIDKIGSRATLNIIEGADHSFSMLKGSGRTNKEVLQELAHLAAEWMVQKQL